MKIALILITFCLFASTEALLRIKSGQFNSSTNTIDFIVQYSGGCKDHQFELKIGKCRESFPVQCDAQLIDLVTDDFCKALIVENVSINLHDAGLDDSYYQGASLRIQNADNSNIIITLP